MEALIIHFVTSQQQRRWNVLYNSVFYGSNDATSGLTSSFHSFCRFENDRISLCLRWFLFVAYTSVAGGKFNDFFFLIPFGGFVWGRATERLLSPQEYGRFNALWKEDLDVGRGRWSILAIPFSFNSIGGAFPVESAFKLSVTDWEADRCDEIDFDSMKTAIDKWR